MPAQRRSIAAAIALACSTLLALAPASWAGDGRFDAGQELSIADPAAIAAGDFNNDGRPDLAAVGTGRRSVELFLQQQNGKLARGEILRVGVEPRVLAVADFNRDGNDDLAVGDATERDLKVRLGTGNGSFTDAPDIELKREPYALVSGDFNGDFADDLAVATRTQGGPHTITVWIGEGDGRFPRGIDSGDAAAALAVADFNSDLSEDLAYGGITGSPNGNVVLGKGNGSFAPRLDVPLPQAAAFRRGWAVGDFDKDSKPDVIAALARDLTAVRLGAGDGTFPRGSEVRTPGTPGAVAVGDFDSDGNEDFVVTDTGGSKSVRVRLGDGAGGFSARPDVPVGASPIDIAVADFNSDGNDDMAVADSDGAISIRTGSGPATLDGNLLVNGGFEGPTPPGKPQPPVAITGWTTEGGMSYARYGSPSHAFWPARIASPRYATGGARMLAGSSAANGGSTSASQLVDVSASARAIDDGRVRANLSAYLGGALQFEDAMTARVEFVDGNTTLGSFQIGPVTAADRNRQTTLLRRAGSSPVPPGTRGIRVTLTATDADKQLSTATADNVKLTLTTAQPGAGQAGGPGGRDGVGTLPPGDAFGRRTLVTLSPASSRLKRGRPLRVRVRNGNGFTVIGRLGRRPLKVGARSTTTLTVKLTARQRRALARKRSLRVRLTALVRDPAGESRRVIRRVRVVSKAKR